MVCTVVMAPKGYHCSSLVQMYVSPDSNEPSYKDNGLTTYRVSMKIAILLPVIEC